MACALHRVTETPRLAKTCEWKPFAIFDLDADLAICFDVNIQLFGVAPKRRKKKTI
jgi:hypothetical protein